MRKITTLLTLLLTCLTGAMAQEYTILVAPGNGTFYRKGVVNTDNWCERFVSTGTPQVTVKTDIIDETNSPYGERKIDLKDKLSTGYYISTGENLKWFISVENGYIITGYKIVGEGDACDCTITPENGTAITFTPGATSTVDVKGLNKTSSYFKTTTITEKEKDKKIKINTFEIYVKRLARKSEITDNAVYTILFKRSSRYMGMYSAVANQSGVPSTAMAAARPTAMPEDASKLMNTLWRFVAYGDNYKIQHVNSGLYLSSFATDTETAKEYITSNADPSSTDNFSLVTSNGYECAIKNITTIWHRDNTSTDRYNFNNSSSTDKITAYYNDLSDEGNIVYLVEVTSIPLSVSAAGWTAFCFPVKVTVPDGVTVYQATSSNGESLHLEEVAAGTVLPAGAGFLCEAAEGTYNFGITAADAADFSSNLLTGATLRRTGMTPNNFYALGNKNGVGFYRVNSETVPANKPFLPASALTSSVREMLSFDFGMATGISNTQNADRTDTSVLYDLNGRRVYYPVRGIYVNGRGEKIFLNK